MSRCPLKARTVFALPEHIPPIAENMRRADIDEIWAAAQVGPEEALGMAMDEGREGIIWTIMTDTGPVGMGGVRKIQSKVGVVWLLGTDWMTEHPVTLMKLAKTHLEFLRERYYILFNFVDDRNEAAKRWLDVMGFTMGPAAPKGPFNLLFRHFWIRGYH
jgi:hypothetical protein